MTDDKANQVLSGFLLSEENLRLHIVKFNGVELTGKHLLLLKDHL